MRDKKKLVVWYDGIVECVATATHFDYEGEEWLLIESPLMFTESIPANEFDDYLKSKTHWKVAETPVELRAPMVKVAGTELKFA